MCMPSKELQIINPLGLHARAAAKLVQLASRYGSEITLTKGDKSANAKSIMKVMMLAASRGSVVEVSTTGNDEDDALSAITTLIEDGFGELE